MKRFISAFIVLLILTVILLLIQKSVVIFNQKSKVQKAAAILPANLPFINNYHQPFTFDSLQSAEHYIIVHFDTECNFCHQQMLDFQQNANQLSDAIILFISNQDLEEINQFRNVYFKAEHQNFVFLSDSRYSFPKIFGTSSIPSTFLYNSRKELVKKYIGEVSVQLLLAQTIRK